MIHPTRDFAISLGLVIIGLIGIFWGYPALNDTEGSLRAVACIVGGFVAVFGFLAAINFWFAIRLRRRLQSHKAAIAHWTLPPAAVQCHITNESQRIGPRPHWQPTATDAAQGLDVVFEPEAVLVGGHVYTMPSSGMQSIRVVHIDPTDPPVLAFQTALYLASGGSAITLRVHKGLLRVPAPDMATADRVCRFFQDVLAGRTIVAPDRWTKRIRWGRWIAIVSALLGGVGLAFAQASGLRADSVLDLIVILLILIGIFGTVAGLAIVAFATRFQRQQQGG
jgi:hypothetical protein